MLLQDLKDIQELVTNATDKDFIPVDKLAKLADEFENSWELLEAILNLSEDDETIYVQKPSDDLREVSDVTIAFKRLKTSEGALQFVYLLMFLKNRNPLIKDKIDYLLEKVIKVG